MRIEFRVCDWVEASILFLCVPFPGLQEDQGTRLASVRLNRSGLTRYSTRRVTANQTDAWGCATFLLAPNLGPRRLKRIHVHHPSEYLRIKLSARFRTGFRGGNRACQTEFRPVGMRRLALPGHA